MTELIVIRVATAEDAAELSRLNIAFNGVYEPPERLARRLLDPRRVETPIVAVVDGRIVGFASLRLAPSIFYPEPQAELTELFVEEAYRRRGVGRALVAHVEQLAREGGAAELLALTGRDNRPALVFYRALGFDPADLALRKNFGDSMAADEQRISG
ncbi:MAG: GNAT family N-acetyltransferase [Chloroflexota bacterium]